MSLHADIDYLKSRISSLKLEFPELEIDESFLADVLEGETDMHNVMSKIYMTLIDADTMAHAIKLRIDEWKDRKGRFDRKSDAARSLILSLMEHAGLSKLELDIATFSLRQIKPTPIVTDVDALPENCVRIERSPDMSAIKAALANGETVTGTAMSNGKTSLTIRTA